MPREELLRSIPSVDALLAGKELTALAAAAPRPVIAEAARKAADEVRAVILRGGFPDATPDIVRRRVIEDATRLAAAAVRPFYRRVINATGIILHTGLGRAVLPAAALEQISRELAGYSLLQADLDSGKRGDRDEPIEALLTKLTGAEAATVVNNNAAATALVLNTVGKGREVIVSRGQLVEIGGSFRLPDVMTQAGVTLVEVGTTNKTHLRDYEAAITENTAAIMRVHPSNYKIVGFTSEVPLDDMARLAHSRNLVMIDDVGAGALVDLSRFGFSYEPTLMDSVKGGADIVTASGDKLIGATQAGIIIGKKALLARVRKNPMARMVRVDKFTLAALEATLRLWLDEAAALREVPSMRMLLRPLPDIAPQADRIAAAIRDKAPLARIEVIDGFSETGSGSLPGQSIPTRLVSIRSDHLAADEIASRLRRSDPPVFARICEGAVLLDPRTLLDQEEAPLVSAVINALT
jgi:L-seryl-tRNA(Ser) seleniumtransferase